MAGFKVDTEYMAEAAEQLAVLAFRLNIKKAPDFGEDEGLAVEALREVYESTQKTKQALRDLIIKTSEFLLVTSQAYEASDAAEAGNVAEK